MKKAKAALKAWVQEVLHESASAHALASGAAIGTFIAILPTPGFNILLGLFLLFVYPKANKLSLFAALALWNPITVTPLYFLSYKIGNALFSAAPIVRYNIVILDQLYNFTRRFLVGNFIVATLIAISTYFIVRHLIIVFRKKPA